MQVWLRNTVQRIQSLRPQRVSRDRVWSRAARGATRTHRVRSIGGTDFSHEALQRLHSWLRTRPQLEHVRLQQCPALEVPGEQVEYDTVILNSVVQYFSRYRPYLLEVLKQAASVVADGGHIFIGDVRHMGLLRLFHTSVQLAIAPATMNVGQLGVRIARAARGIKNL